MQINKNEFEILKKSLRELNSIEFVIDGNSMEPLIKNRTKILISRVDDLKSLRRFDIIVVCLNDRLICHYFWKMNQVYLHPEMNTIVTRPLNPITGYDAPVSINNILGRSDVFSLTLLMKLKIAWYFLKRKLSSK